MHPSNETQNDDPVCERLAALELDDLQGTHGHSTFAILHTPLTVTVLGVVLKGCPMPFKIRLTGILIDIFLSLAFGL